MTDTVQRATGRWKEILPRLGVSPKFLLNRHGPCPICGGVDRFRFDDRNGTGSYYCNQCGAGVGIILVRKLNGWDHRTACSEIDKLIGNAPRPVVQQQPVQRGDRASAIRRLLDEAMSPAVVDSYLTRRGINIRSPALRGHNACAYVSPEGKLVGRYPAVIAPVTGTDSELVSAQRIYTAADLDPRKKVMPPVTTITGGAVRLFDVGTVMGIAEGVETALAAAELFDMPVWAALSANGLEKFQPPPLITSLIIFADNDASFVGQVAAFSLAKRLSCTTSTKVRIPPETDTDWADVIQQRKRQNG